MSDDAARVRLTFRDGGWVLVLMAVAIVALLAWAFAGVLAGHRPRGGGDVASYGFDLSTCLVPREQLTSTRLPRDFVRTLEVASTMPASDMPAFNASHRKRYVVSNDRVVGVAINGEARAYPLYVLDGHEAIEDTLGGVPIVVMYSPFCDAAQAYDRRVDGRTLSFGVSGLVRDANTLFYDREPGAESTSSLWQQLDGTAIAGPLAAKSAKLAPIASVALTTFSDWVSAHPTSSVIARDEGLVKLYEGISYERAHESSDIGFPVAALPASSAIPLKEPVIVVELDGVRRAYAIESARRATSTEWRVRHGDADLVIHLPTVRGTARVSADGREPVVTPTFWFAAPAILGVTDVVRADDGATAPREGASATSAAIPTTASRTAPATRCRGSASTSRSRRRRRRGRDRTRRESLGL